jgi:GNAT superfamily N-acetyltransferase
VRIESIAAHPELVETVARWQFTEWGHLEPGDSLAARIASLRAQVANPERIPATLIALDGDEPLGSASIEDDMDAPTPRLVRVYVKAEARGRGVGTALVRRVMTEAEALGVPRLYLFTKDARGLYEKLGWHVIASRHSGEYEIAIMAADLVSAGAPAGPR